MYSYIFTSHHIQTNLFLPLLQQSVNSDQTMQQLYPLHPTTLLFGDRDLMILLESVLSQLRRLWGGHFWFRTTMPSVLDLGMMLFLKIQVQVMTLSPQSPLRPCQCLRLEEFGQAERGSSLLPVVIFMKRGHCRSSGVTVSLVSATTVTVSNTQNFHIRDRTPTRWHLSVLPPLWCKSHTRKKCGHHEVLE